MIRIENITKSFGPKFVLKDVSYHFPAAHRIALVGANGAGKSTLLNIICGLEEADSGRVEKPSSMHFSYLPQEPNPNPKETVLKECMEGAAFLTKLQVEMEFWLVKMETSDDPTYLEKFLAVEQKFRNLGGLKLENDARCILLGLGFAPSLLEQNPVLLSGGLRMRLELAKVFIAKPSFLILDEPTNHLDLPSLMWVENFLKSFEGTLLFVSHDRALLNRLATLTLHLNKGELTPYVGNFDSFLEQKELKESQNEKSLARLQKRMGEIASFVDRFKAKASKAKQAQSKLKMLMRLKSLESEFENDDDTDSIFFSMKEPIQSGREVLKTHELCVGYEHKILSKNISLTITRGQKVAIIGANGIGKSTFLKTLAGKNKLCSGMFQFGHNVNFAYFAQEQKDVFDDEENILNNVMRFSPEHTKERDVRSMLGSFLFRGDDVFKPFSVLSGGEKSRVGLVTLLLQNANFLILDEPTNHLDMSSCTMLSRALDDYAGTVLFVSHDRDFIDSFATHIFAMTADGQSACFEGHLDDYERLAKVSGFPNVLEHNKFNINHTSDKNLENSKPKPSSTKQNNPPSKNKSPQFIKKLEEDMAHTTMLLEKSEKELENAATAGLYQKSYELGIKIKELKAKLQNLEEQWLEGQ